MNPLDAICNRPRQDAICVSQLKNARHIDKGILQQRPDVKIFLPFRFLFYRPEEVFQPQTYNRFLGKDALMSVAGGSIHEEEANAPRDKYTWFLSNISRLCSEKYTIVRVARNSTRDIRNYVRYIVKYVPCKWWHFFSRQLATIEYKKRKSAFVWYRNTCRRYFKTIAVSCTFARQFEAVFP